MTVAVEAAPIDVDAGEEYAPFVVEQRGIDYIPASDRHMTPGQLARMWAGGLTTVGTLVYGLTIMSLGLSFAQAALIILLGNLSFVAVGFASLQGPRAGTSAMTVTRAPFGRNGTRPIALFNWATVLGFETLSIALVVIAGTVLMTKAGFSPGTPAKVVLTLLTGVLLLVLPLFGHATITKALRVLLVPFIVLFIIFAVLTLGQVNLEAVKHGAGWGTMMVALAITISAGGLGWANQANDFSRYVHAEAKSSEIIWKVTLGCYLPQTILMLMGALVGTVMTSGTNPFTDLPKVFAAWFLVPYLIVGIVQILGETTLDLYSSGLSLQTVGLRLRRSKLVVIDLVIGTGLAIAVVLSKSFYQDLNDFVLFIIVWLAPWFGIFAVDWWLRRGSYNGPGLVKGSVPPLQRTRGVRVPAIVAQAIGMAACLMWLNAYPVYVSPLSSRIGGGSDFSVFTGTIVAAAVYYLLARRQVRAEGRRTADPTLLRAA